MNNLISVIVPIYNVAEYLPECIESIINQTYKNIEIILVDDGSTDNSGQICDEYAKKDSRIVVIHQENKGLVGARKSGVKIAKGDYIGYVDGDDWIEPQMYEHLLQEILETDADFVDSGYYIRKPNYDNNLIYPFRRKKDCFCLDDNTRKNMIQSLILINSVDNINLIPSIWSKLFKKDIILKAQNMVSNVISFGEDLVCILYAIQYSKKIALTDKYYYNYRVREQSITRPKQLEYLVPEYIYFLNGIYEFFDKYSYDEYYKKIANYHIFYSIVDYSNNKISDVNKKFDFIAYTNEKIMHDKKVVLYGAGIVGKNYYKHYQNTRNDFEIVAWVDKNYKNLTDYPMPIEAPENIKNYDYDYVLVCIKDKNIFDEIKNELIALGIPEEKILYNERENTLAWLYK